MSPTHHQTAATNSRISPSHTAPHFKRSQHATSTSPQSGIELSSSQSVMNTGQTSSSRVIINHLHSTIFTFHNHTCPHHLNTMLHAFANSRSATSPIRSFNSVATHWTWNKNSVEQRHCNATFLVISHKYKRTHPLQLIQAGRHYPRAREKELFETSMARCKPRQHAFTRNPHRNLPSRRVPSSAGIGSMITDLSGENIQAKASTSWEIVLLPPFHSIDTFKTPSNVSLLRSATHAQLTDNATQSVWATFIITRPMYHPNRKMDTV